MAHQRAGRELAAPEFERVRGIDRCRPSERQLQIEGKSHVAAQKAARANLQVAKIAQRAGVEIHRSRQRSIGLEVDGPAAVDRQSLAKRHGEFAAVVGPQQAAVDRDVSIDVKRADCGKTADLHGPGVVDREPSRAGGERSAGWQGADVNLRGAEGGRSDGDAAGAGRDAVVIVDLVQPRIQAVHIDRGGGVYVSCRQQDVAGDVNP